MTAPEQPPEAAPGFTEYPEDEPYPGVTRKRFDTHHATVATYRFEPGAEFPLHRHPQEQIMLVTEGELEFTVGSARRQMSAPEWSLVPPNVEHGLRAGSSGAAVHAIVIPRRDDADDYTVVED